MIRYALFVLNFFFALLGIGLVAIGAYVQINMAKYADFLGEQYLHASIVLIILGFVVAIVASFGCCGICTENPCLIYTYASMMSVILLSSIGVGISIFVYKDEVKDIVQKYMQQGMTNYKKPGYDGVTETWNILQNDFKCCGVESYTDWKEVDFGVTGDVPDDCCLNPHTDCGEGKADMDEQRAKEFIYVKGCIAKLESEIAGNSDVAIAIGAAVAIFIIINIVVSCKIAKNIRGHSISA